MRTVRVLVAVLPQVSVATSIAALRDVNSLEAAIALKKI
jgi:hypothetical protein